MDSDCGASFSERSFHRRQSMSFGAGAVTPSSAVRPGTKPMQSSRRASVGDRFIPSRRNSDFDAAHFLAVTNGSSCLESPVFRRGEVVYNPSTPCYKTSLASLSESRNELSSVFSFDYKQNTPDSANGSTASPFLTNGSTASPFFTKHRLHVPKSPDNCLDMPDFKDDFYSNNLDWSVHDFISVGLCHDVYCWNHENKELQEVEGPDPNPDSCVKAVSWHPKGRWLAVGTDTGYIAVYQHKSNLKKHILLPNCVHVSSILALAWNPDGRNLYSGTECGCILCYSSRDWSNMRVMRQDGSRVCSLKVSPDGRYLAAGGNDSLISLLDLKENNTISPIHAHNAAVKAIAWCPNRPGVLASGGGYGDGHIRIWNIKTGDKIAEVGTESQICSMVWCDVSGVLITGHGVDYTDVIVWCYPELEPIARLEGHRERVLHLALSPNGSMIASCASDECLMLWDCSGAIKKLSKRRNSFTPTQRRSSLQLFSSLR